MIGSISVCEAVRIQHFQDDCCFMRNRPHPYHRVVDDVPPYLAYQIGQRVWAALRG